MKNAFLKIFQKAYESRIAKFKFRIKQRRFRIDIAHVI